MMAALISFGFALFEKAEKYGYSENLKHVASQLDLANMTTSVLESLLSNTNAPPPPMFLASGEFEDSIVQPARRTSGNPIYGSPSNGDEVDDVVPLYVDELIRIENKKLEELSMAPQQRNNELLRQLITREQYLKHGLGGQ